MIFDRIEAALTPGRRRWLYRITWATAGLLGVYGLISHEELAGWLLVAAAVLGIADGHTDPTSPNGMPAPRRAKDAEPR